MTLVANAIVYSLYLPIRWTAWFIGAAVAFPILVIKCGVVSGAESAHYWLQDNAGKKQ